MPQPPDINVFDQHGAAWAREILEQEGASEAAQTLAIFEEARRSWGNEMLGITVDALRKIAAMEDGFGSRMKTVAKEALAEIEEDGVTGAASLAGEQPPAIATVA